MNTAWESARGMAQKHNANGGLFIRLGNDGDKVVGAFCGDPYPREVIWTGERYETYDASNPDHHVEGQRPSFRVALNFYVPAENTMKVLEVGTKTFKDILQCREKYTLEGWTFEVKRHGEGTRTTYSVLPERQVDDVLRAKLNETELHDLHAIAGGRAASPKPSNDAPATTPGYIDAPTAMRIIGQLKALPRGEVDALLRRFNVNRVRELREADVEAFTREVEQLEGGTALSDEVDPFA
ncbi:MAG: hypothetical protein R3B89_07890 [Polyangiaceae bacterium]